MRVLMLVWTGVATDTRVLREATTLVDAGHEVHIIGRGVPPELQPPSGITVASAGQPPMAQGRSRELTAVERVVRWLLLPNHVERRLRAWRGEARGLASRWAAKHGRPDVVHAHEYTALTLGADLADEWQVPFVYDSHEYWRGRPVEGRWAPLRALRERRSEAEVAARAAAIITVGDGVAKALRRDHPTWPAITVVRNTFPLREIVSPEPGEPTGLVYAGRLAADRELEVLARASSGLPLPMTLVGPGDQQWLDSFDPGSAQVLPAEPLSAVDERLVAAGIALVTHSDKWENHRLALPNKLFHAVSLGVPVVATDVGELGAIVREHGLGTLYRPGDVDGVRRAVEELVGSYAQFRRAVMQARPELSWDRDGAALRGLYAQLR